MHVKDNSFIFRTIIKRDLSGLIKKQDFILKHFVSYSFLQGEREKVRSLFFYFLKQTFNNDI